jgi:lactoylglutathione lyase
MLVTLGFRATSIKNKEDRMSQNFEDCPGLCENPDPETQSYVFNQTMMRIKDPKVSLDFYTRVIGMRLLRKLDFPEMKFTLYFLGMVEDEDAKLVPKNSNRRTTWVFEQKAMLELTHNWGTENDPDFHYHNGNAQPQGFGRLRRQRASRASRRRVREEAG